MMFPLLFEIVDIGPQHEGRRSPGPEPEWTEGHRLDLLVPAEALAVSFQVSVRRADASFTAVVLEQGELPVVIADHEIPLPGVGWEIRGSGLWADHICETPLDHWSYGLEAFALAIDDPNELLGRAIGDRVPLGWEIEFEAEARPTGQPEAYQQTGVGHGLLLSAAGEREFEGIAVRSHWSGGAANQLTSVVVEAVPGLLHAPDEAPLTWIAIPDEPPGKSPSRVLEHRLFVGGLGVGLR